MDRTTVLDRCEAPTGADGRPTPGFAPGITGGELAGAGESLDLAPGITAGERVGGDSPGARESTGGGKRVGDGERAGGREVSLERLWAVVGGLVCPPSRAADVAELEECLVRSRKARSWLDAYDAGLIAEAERRGAAEQTGAVNTAAWLRRHTGMSFYESRTRTRTSDGLDDVPAIRAALADGRITHGHARALTRLTSPEGVDMSVGGALDFPSSERTVADAAREHLESLLVAAATMTVDDYGRFLNRWADRVSGDDGAERDSRHLRNRRVTTSENHDGMGILRAVLPPAQFAVIENEMRRLADAAWRAEHPDAEGISAKELSCPQRNADALAKMAERSRQLADIADEPLGSHTDVMVIVDAQTLDHGLHAESRCELDTNLPITPATARRLACDANILTAIFDRKTLDLNLGRNARCANRNIRKALIARDRTCTAPGCDRPHWMCQIHHKTPWSEGGRTDLENLTLLCHKHHHQHHANENRKPPPGPNSPGAATAGSPAQNSAQAARNGARPPGDGPPGNSNRPHGKNARTPRMAQPARPQPNKAAGPPSNGTTAPQNGARPPSAGQTAPTAPNGETRPAHRAARPPGNGATAPQNGSRLATVGPPDREPGISPPGDGARPSRTSPPPEGPKYGTAGPPGNGTRTTSADRPEPTAPNGATSPPPNGAAPPSNGAAPPQLTRTASHNPEPGSRPPNNRAGPPDNGAEATRASRQAPPDRETPNGSPANGAEATRVGRPPPAPEPAPTTNR